MIRKHLYTLLAVAFSCVLQASALAADVRIGIMPYLAYSGLLYAKQMGWVEEEVKKVSPSTSVQWRQFVAGAPVSEGLAAGELDLGMFGGAPAIIGRASGQDTRIVALASTGSTTHALVARSALNITSVGQLKGLKVATTFGSTVYELLIRALAEGGLARGDVQLLNMTPPDMGTALRTGSIDAAVVWDPLLITLLKDRSVTILRDGKGINDNINLLIARAAYLNANKDVVKGIIRGLQRANDAISANPKAIAMTLAPTFGLTVDDTEMALRRYTFALPVTPALKDQLTESVAFMFENKIIRRSIPIDAFVDLSAIP